MIFKLLNSHWISKKKEKKWYFMWVLSCLKTLYFHCFLLELWLKTRQTKNFSLFLSLCLSLSCILQLLNTECYDRKQQTAVFRRDLPTKSQLLKCRDRNIISNPFFNVVCEILFNDLTNQNTICKQFSKLNNKISCL